MTTLWIFFASLIVALVALDLGVLRRRPRVVTRGWSVAWTAVWFVAALAFNAGLYWAFGRNWRGLGLPGPDGAAGISAEEASLQFLTAYLIEICLSLDNVFVMAPIFAHFRIPEELRQRVLTVGLLVAFVVRTLLVLGYSWFTASFTWAIFVLGGLLLLAALRMVVIRQKSLDPQSNLIIRVIRFFFPLSESLEGENLVTRIDGRLAFTRLATALLFIETADLLFAVESIPASFAVAKDPFIIVTANILALFATRSLYFALADLTNWVRYVKIGLALVLAYCAVLIINTHHFRTPIGTEVSLIVLIGLVSGGVVAGLLFAKPGPAPMVSPLGEDADRVAKLALRQAAKLISFVVGVTVTIIGILMLPGPGPGLVVIPIGLAILAAEFLWARRLLQKYTETAQRLGQKAGTTFIKQPKPWLIPLVIGATASAITAVVLFTAIKPSLIASFGGGMLIGQSIWGYMQMYRYRQVNAELQTKGEVLPPPTAAPISVLIGVTLVGVVSAMLLTELSPWRVAVSALGLLAGELVCVAVVRWQIRGQGRPVPATPPPGAPTAR